MCLRTWHSRAHACAQIERERKKENKKSNNSNKTKPPLHDSVAKAIAQASQLTQHARTRARQHTHLPRGEGETSDNKNCTKKQVPTPESEPQTHPSLHSPTFLVCQTCTNTAPVSLALVTDHSSHHRHNHNYRHPSCPHVLGIPPPLSCPLARAVITHSNRARKRPDWLPYLLGREFRSETSMDSFTQESDESSSCTQSDEDSTNSSSGTNPFFLCPRGTTLQISGQSRLQDATEDPGKLKYARMDPYGYHQYRASAIANPVGISNLPFSHNAIGAIHGSDGLRGSPLFLQSRSYVPSSLEDCRGLAAQVTSSARPPRPYLGLQPQGYSLGHETTGNTPSSTMLLSENCKLDKMSGNLGKTSGNFLLGLADPQPGRCRRTDGKKWRCGRAVVPEQKYCERHMHRGRGRSKAAKLARFSGGVDMNRLHNTERHPNPPYIELLNHLSVPAEPFSQPLGVAQHSSVSAQALMVPETTQSLQQEYVHAPNFMQHAVAESSEQLVTGSNVIDSPTNQSPMQAEPLNLLQSNGRLPVLAQAIPMNEVTKVKFRHDPVNGSVTDEARVTIQDPNDILSLDVQAIKQLLENAPCSMRPRNSMNRQQQLLNVADLLNVAHIRNLHSQPKKPPPLMDILRMVNPATASNTSLNSISLIDHQSKSMIDDNQIAHNDHYAQVVMDSSGARDDRTVLSLACTDKALENQNSQYRLNKVSAVSSSSRMQSEGKMLPMSIEFDTQGGEGYDQDKQVAGRFRRYSEGECIESMTKDDSAGPLSDLTEGCGNRLENISYRASEVANGSHSGLHSLVEKDKDCFRSSNNFNRQNLAEESSRCRSIENLKSIRSDVKHSTAAQESNKQYKSSTSVEEKGNPSSKNGVINFQEKYMKSESCNVIFLEEERSDTCSSSSSEKTLDEHGDSGATEMISPIAKKRMDKKENFVNLDMNRPILDVEDMSQHGDNGLRRLSATSMLGVVSAFEQSSSEVESFNRNGFPKSTLTLEPVPLSNPEQTTQISLVN